MFGPLTPSDFPLYHVGPLVYRRTESSPLFTAPNETVAADLVFRLNRDQFEGASGLALAAGNTTLVYGRG